MCLLNEDTLYVRGRRGFYLIKISTHKILTNLLLSLNIFSVYKYLDGLILYSVIYKKRFCSIEKYQYTEQNLNIVNIKENTYDKKILTCIE